MRESDHDRIRQAAVILHDVAKPMRVLSALSWPGEIRDRFLANGANRAPEPVYVPIDPEPVIDGVAAARRLLRPGEVVDDWLEREADSIVSTANMLASVGTPAFHEYSGRLYGVPDQPLRFDQATPLQLATRVGDALSEPLADDTVIDGLIRLSLCVVWVALAVILVTTVVEVVHAVRHRGLALPDVRGVGWAQPIARYIAVGLVAVLPMMTSATSLASTLGARAAPAASIAAPVDTVEATPAQAVSAVRRAAEAVVSGLKLRTQEACCSCETTSTR